MQDRETAYMKRKSERDLALSLLLDADARKALLVVAEELRAQGASDDEVVAKVRNLIFGEPTLRDALLKSLNSPGAEVTLDDRGVTVQKRNASVTVREGEPLGSLSSGARTIDPGLFVNTMVAAKRRRGRDDERLEKAREDLAAAYGGDLAVAKLEKSRAKRVARQRRGAT